LSWIIEYADTALKQLKEIDRQTARSIFEYLNERVAQLENPRVLSKKIADPQYGAYWRSRVGSAHVICDIKDRKLIILLAEDGHRKQIYRRLVQMR
jgi:mRNA interferase RelE/StbE